MPKLKELSQKELVDYLQQLKEKSLTNYESLHNVLPKRTTRITDSVFQQSKQTANARFYSYIRRVKQTGKLLPQQYKEVEQIRKTIKSSGSNVYKDMIKDYAKNSGKTFRGDKKKMLYLFKESNLSNEELKKFFDSWFYAPVNEVYKGGSLQSYNLEYGESPQLSKLKYFIENKLYEKSSDEINKVVTNLTKRK